MVPVAEYQNQVFDDTASGHISSDVLLSFQNAQRLEYDDSLDTDSEFENDLYYNDAQQQWEENVEQIKVALFAVLCPVIGKMIGRKTAHSLWARFVTWRWQTAQKAGKV